MAKMLNHGGGAGAESGDHGDTESRRYWSIVVQSVASSHGGTDTWAHGDT